MKKSASNSTTTPKNSKKLKWFGLGAILLVVGAAALLLMGGILLGVFSLSRPGSSAQGSQTQTIGQEQKNCRMTTVQEPYGEQECNTVPYQEQQCNTVPYTDKECTAVNLKYTKSEKICRTEGWLGDWIVSSCQLANLDEQGGNFKVNVGVIVDGQKLSEEQEKYIYPLTTQKFEYKIQAKGSSCYCDEISIPTKQVCRDVIKTKEVCNPVTKYRQDCKQVTKYRDAQKEVCN